MPYGAITYIHYRPLRMDRRQLDVTPTFGGNPTPPIYGAPDEDRGPVMLGVCSTLTAVALLTVMARMYVLGKMNRVAGYDDITIIIAMVSIPVCPHKPRMGFDARTVHVYSHPRPYHRCRRQSRRPSFKIPYGRAEHDKPQTILRETTPLPMGHNHTENLHRIISLPLLAAQVLPALPEAMCCILSDRNDLCHSRRSPTVPTSCVRLGQVKDWDMLRLKNSDDDMVHHQWQMVLRLSRIPTKLTRFRHKHHDRCHICNPASSYAVERPDQENSENSTMWHHGARLLVCVPRKVRTVATNCKSVPRQLQA